MQTLRLPEIRKIAVLRANALGDFIFVLPALNALRTSYPNAEITYLGKKWHKKFLKNRPSPVDKVIVVPPSRGVAKPDDFTNENKKEVTQFFHRMQDEKFDIAIQLHGGGKYSNQFIKKLGAKLTVGLCTPDAEELDISIPYIYYENEIHRYLEVVAACDAKTADIEPRISITRNDLEEALQFLGDDTPYIVLHPGASDIRRRCKPELFAIVGDVLAKQGYKIIVTGTKEEEDIVRRVIESMTASAENCCNKLSLNGLTGLLAKASLVISNDTGPLHLANAIKTPTVGLYWCANLINAGEINRAFSRPVVSWIINCSLCGSNCAENYPFEPRNSCMHEISFMTGIKPEQVIDQAISLLLLKNDKSIIQFSI